MVSKNQTSVLETILLPKDFKFEKVSLVLRMLYKFQLETLPK